MDEFVFPAILFLILSLFIGVVIGYNMGGIIRDLKMVV